MYFPSILVFIAQQILIYGGILMILFGMFGSLMIIFIFRRKPLKQKSCSIYFIGNAILSVLFLPFYFLPNILTFGFEINWMGMNTWICKFHTAYGAFSATSVFIINCFISFDRYAMSSRSVRTRSFSSKKMARILLSIGLLLVICLISTPVMVLFENLPVGINGAKICTSKSSIFLLFIALIYYPILEGVLPVLLAIFFWFFHTKTCSFIEQSSSHLIF